MIKKNVYIDGMSCSHCQRRVEEMFKKQREVREVKVDLKEKKAELLLDSDMSDKQIKELVEDIDYEVRKIERA